MIREAALAAALAAVTVASASASELSSRGPSRHGIRQIGAVLSTRTPIGAARTQTRSEGPRCTLFVSPQGHGRATGRSARFPTLLAKVAFRTAAPGSVVCLEPGTYDTNTNIVLARSGTPSAPIYYRSYGGRALLRYTGRSLSGGVLQTLAEPGWHGTHDVVIDGLTIDGGNLIGGGVFVSTGSHDITIKNCTIRDTGATGIGLDATDYVTVQNNVIYHTGYNQGWSSGISLWYGGVNTTYGSGSGTAAYDGFAGFHNFIVGNVVSGAYDNSQYQTEGNGIIVDGSGAIPPALIANNIVYGNGGSGIVVFHNTGDIWVVNNTAYANGLDLIPSHGLHAEYLVAQASNVHLINDLAYGRGPGSRYARAYLFNNAQSAPAMSHDIGFGGPSNGVAGPRAGPNWSFRNANPRFVSLPTIPATQTPWATSPPWWAVRHDFRLRAHSPARPGAINPLHAAGITPALATGMMKYLLAPPPATSHPRTSHHR
jgi:parallel beta-helix repeat protein